MALTKNLYYSFTNVAYSDMALGYYGTPIANLKNVCIWKKNTNDRRQVWKYQTDTVGDRLHVAIDTAYVLDRSSGATTSYANNAHLYKGASTSAADSALIFEDLSSGVYRIKLSDGKCLTAANNSNGKTAETITTQAALSSGVRNVYWAAAASSESSMYNKQCWKATIIGAPINSEVTVTSMPPCSGYSNQTEYFHPESGMQTGTWSANGGSSIKEKLRTIYKKVYKEFPTTAGENNALFYTLYGAKLRNTSTYHIGVDINSGGKAVYSPVSGTVKLVESKGNHSVAIYDGKRTYYFLHMNPVNPEIKVGKAVSVGTHLGTESDYGNANGKHLHIEVYEGLETGGPKNPVIVSKSMPTICPYDYL